MVRRTWWSLSALVAIAAAKYVPFIVAGPELLMDDWLFVRNALFDGAWEAPAGGLTTRPGSYVAYVATFGVTQNPRILLAILSVVNAVTALTILMAFRRWLPEWQAAVAAGAWLAIPSHTATDYWMSAFVGPLSLLLLTGGAWAYGEAYHSKRGLILPGLMLVASVAVYEISILLAVVILFAVPRLESRRIRWRPTLAILFGIVAVAIWIAGQAVYQVRGRLDPAVIWRLNFGLGVSHSPWYEYLGILATLGIGVALAVAIYRERKGCRWLPGRLILVGLVLLAMGVTPAISFPFSIEGFGDRVNVAGAIGAGLVWTGVLSALPDGWLPVRAGGIAFLLAVSLAQGFAMMNVYVDSGREARAWALRHAGSTTQTVRSQDLPASRQGVFGLCCDGVTTAAVQFTAHSPRAIVKVVD